MGSNISVNDSALARGWNATVSLYLGTDVFGAAAHWTINIVADLALNLGRKVQNTLDGTFVSTLRQIHELASYAHKTLASYTPATLSALTTVAPQLVANHLATNEDFVYFCDLLLGRIVNKVLTHPVVMDSFKGALQHCLTQLGGEHTGPIADALAKILTDAISQLSQKAAGSLVPDITTNTLALVVYTASRTDVAYAYARNFFVTSVAINGSVLVFNLLYTRYLYREKQCITGDEYKRYAKKKIKATFGTIIGGTAGGYAATLIAPNNSVIRFLGGFLGGFIGEQVASRYI